MGYGFKITRDGVDASSTDKRDFVLHSDNKNYKSLNLATTSLVFNSAVASTVESSIAHGLGYAPNIFAYIELSSGSWYDITQRSLLIVPGWGGAAIDVFAETDDTNIHFFISSFYVGSKTFSIKYFTVIDEK